MTDKKTNNDTPAENGSAAAKPANNKPGQASAKATKPQTSAAKEAAKKPTPEKAAPEKPAATQPTAPAEKKSGSKTGAIAIALVIALGAGLYYHGHQQTQAQNAQMAQLNDQIAAMKQQLAASQQDTLGKVSQAMQRTDVTVEQQEKSISSLQMALAEMKGRRPNDWLLAEADYLVKMAGRKLWLEHDVVSATVLLESADNRIAELNDPSLTPVRKAMNSDITALKSVARIDRDGLVLRLTSLQEEVANLPLANAIMPEAEKVEEAAVSTSVNDWKTNLMTSLKNFSDHFITYRKRDGNVIPLLSPKQDFYLQENIKSKLETAIKAVYREEGELYGKSLTMAKEWAEQFYNQDAPATQSFIKTLDQLAGERIEASYPTHLQSQPMITDLISERLRNQVKPISTEENPA
ncbi:heme biosynthesis operon protein HemX [Photobacterium jeanii]|uniref:Heme biosynthesis operon protein HemX n=1 Tax=Photobacterium jeanii TaxID=858640 RepID=A0A178KQE2_9GAMM|nr:uroporphyrinogen-III C-methyltransferase [Photobacterium jeanii]OAN19165.1 heme biosynthesis operon protein HemX [Photobacterium jeanii]PST87172.1 uroporphyrinogen-III C-methyltransferase [Photobacterium jeanii]